MNLTAHHLHFSLEVQTCIELGEYKGSALRGLLFNALRGPEKNPALGFCTQRHLKNCADCALVAVCPVASLVSTLNPASDRGRDVPRPYTIVPPLEDKTCYEPGERLSFGLTLFGQALNLFPYVVMGLRQAEAGGLGKRLGRPETNGRPVRGRFTLRAAQALNLLTGEVQDILAAGNPLVHQPALPVTHAQVLDFSRRLLSRRLIPSANGHGAGAAELRPAKSGPVELCLHFKTPLRIIERERLLKSPEFRPIFQRLLERLEALNREFGQVSLPLNGVPFHPPTETSPAGDMWELLPLADQVELVDDQSRWAEVWSYSSRQGGKTPLGGLIGRATYQAEAGVWEKLLPYLLWGSLTHVGKSAVKGNGWYQVEVGK